MSEARTKRDPAVDVLPSESPPGEPLAPAHAAPAAPFDPGAATQQLADLMRMYLAQGLIHQRPDGSFILPGQSNPVQEHVLQIGSLCQCPLCSEHNQLHWRCVICLQVHEWSTNPPGQDKQFPRGQVGRGGMRLYAVDSDSCKREYLQRQGGMGGVTVPGMARTIPVAGGDESGFFVPGV